MASKVDIAHEAKIKCWKCQKTVTLTFHRVYTPDKRHWEGMCACGTKNYIYRPSWDRLEEHKQPPYIREEGKLESCPPSLGAVHIFGLHRRHIPDYRVAMSSKLLTALGYEAGSTIEGAGGVKFPEEILDSLTPGSVLRIEVSESGAIGVKETGKTQKRPPKESPEEALERLRKEWPLTIEDTGLEQLRQLDKDEAAALSLAIRTEGSKPAQSRASVSTAEVIEDCVRALHVSDRTIRSYRGTWATFAKRHPVFPTTVDQVNDYLNRYTNRRTAADVYTKLKILYDFASARYGVPDLFSMRLIRKPKFKPTDKGSLTLEEVKAVVNACRDDFELGLIHLYVGHGLRKNEAREMDIGDIRENEIFVHGKTKNEPAPVLSETRLVLLKQEVGRGLGEPLFISQRRSRISERENHNIIKGILLRAGINRKGCCCHLLRHSFSTLAQEAGMPFPVCQRLMRHSPRTQTEQYTHFSRQFLREQLERYSPIKLINEGLPSIAYFRQSAEPSGSEVLLTEGDPAQLLPQLLDQLITLGQAAHELRHALGANGHRAELLNEIIEYIEHRARR